MSPGDFRAEFDFANGPQGWTSGFSDYTIAMGPGMDLVADYRPLASPLDTSTSALFIAGTNHSSDLFMFYTRRVDGLQPDQTYRVSLTIEIATDVRRGCAGIGGPPGEGVIVKAGASTAEPRAQADGTHYVMNIAKDGQANLAMRPIGNVANSIDCENPARWQKKTLSTGSDQVHVRSSADGSAWVIVGTDSGFAGRTGLYYTRVAASFARAN